MAMSCIPLLVNQPQIPTQGIDANVATARLRLRDPIPPDDTEWGWNVVMLNASADAGVREWGRSAGRSLAAAIFSTETFLSPRDFVPWLGARAQGRAADYLVAVIVAGEELSVPVAELQATIDSLRAMPEQALTTIILVTTSLRWMELRGLDGAIRVPHDMLGRAGASAYRSLCGLMAPEQLMCLDMEDVYPSSRVAVSHSWPRQSGCEVATSSCSSHRAMRRSSSAAGEPSCFRRSIGLASPRQPGSLKRCAAL